MMLKRLSIVNLAIIEELEVFFDTGLNIITGETGAGKSILISSLKLILGQKPDADMIRTGADKMIVEAEFCDISEGRKKILEKNGIETAVDLIIRREVYRTKRSRIFINDTPSNAEVLVSLGNYLIDIHGQHDHQSLLIKDTHIKILDEFSAVSTDLIASLYEKSIEIKKERERLIRAENELRDKKELFSYHLKEINEVSPVEGEDTEISDDLKKMDRIEDIKSICSKITSDTDPSEGSALSALGSLLENCSELAKTDKQFEPFITDLECAYQAVKEFGSSAEYFSSSLEFDEERHRKLSDRYALLRRLMKKFGPGLSDVIKYRDDITGRIRSMDEFVFDREKLEKEHDELNVMIEKECRKLTAERKAGASEFESCIRQEFSDVGLNDAEIKLRIEEKTVSSDGADSVEFYIRTNPGEEHRPLSKTASGGEVSRIMLSVKNMTGSETENIISVFDEIDTGISGRIAEKVGDKLLKLAKQRQVIAITHLPAIASKGSTHFSVRKRVSGKRTVVDVMKLNEKERTKEIASLITSAGDDEDIFNIASRMISR